MVSTPWLFDAYMIIIILITMLENVEILVGKDNKKYCFLLFN